MSNLVRSMSAERTVDCMHPCFALLSDGNLGEAVEFKWTSIIMSNKLAETMLAKWRLLQDEADERGEGFYMRKSKSQVLTHV
jgi:hypothetical protein